MFNNVITLISESKTVDEYGDLLVNEAPRTVFCDVQSIGQKEFYEAHASGLKPEIKFILADYFDYDNEKVLEYEGTRYHVLRTYRTGHELELTCYSEVNENGRS